MIRLRSALCAALVVGVLGCEDKIVTSSGTPSAPAKRGAPSAVALAAPPPRPAIDESEFVESERSRDPFRSYARTFVPETTGAGSAKQVDVLMSEYSLDELRLIGIVTRVQPAKAMLVDPTGKGHVIQRGQFVGRPDVVQGAGVSSAYEINWRVDRIRDIDVVFVREDPQNRDVPTITRVIPLRPEGTQVQ